MTQSPASEILFAEKQLKSLIGEEIPTVQLQSLDATEAPFLGQVVSKLSPLLGNLMENRIVSFLNNETRNNFLWKRQDPDFPDASLRHLNGEDTGYGFEIKAWYALSTELTGRFRESANLLAKKNVKVVVVAWMMSHIIYGTPKIIDVLIVDSKELAKDRDNHYHKPPDYLIVEPNDTTLRTSNLQQTNVLGYKWQETDPKLFKSASDFVARLGASHDPNTKESQKVAQELMNKYAYRLDTNFAKIDRIDNQEIETFKSEVLKQIHKGKKVSEWSKLLSNLLSDDEVKRTKSEKEIQNIYDNL
jgi:hypothetical protein